MERNIQQALTGSIGDFRLPEGSNLLDRVTPYFEWQDNRRVFGLWPFSKAYCSSPRSECSIEDDAGIQHHGINFSSQDYLSLAAHPAVHEAAIRAVHDFGVHSAGSSSILGNTQYSLQLEKEIGSFLNMDYVQLFPTGWAAGYGVISGLVRPNDYVVMDILTHACLQSGASSSTKNIFKFRHNNASDLKIILSRIRRNDTQNAILVVTEGLFSMDSDYPNLIQMQELCNEFNATLLVDVAHDLGAMGPGGTGTIGQMGLLGKIDLVMGSFSKTFASNGGFVATAKRAVKEYLIMNSNPQTFSNALSPVQAAVVVKAFEIVRSPEGDIRRARLMENVLALRKGMEDENIALLGVPSAIVPVVIGSEPLIRLTNRRLVDLNILVNLVEYPAVARRSARFRFQVMSDHTTEQTKMAAKCVAQALGEAREELRKIGGYDLAPREETDVEIELPKILTV